jgi:serine/threonine protein kinase
MACDDRNCKIYNKDNTSMPCTTIVLPSGSCQGPWFMKERTGEKSSNSMIYQVFNDDGVMNILKQIIYDRYNTKTRAIREIDIHVSVATAGLAPSILEVMYNDEGCSIIMYPLKDTMDRIIYNIISNKDDINIVHHLVATAVALLGELHKLGITHNDAHTNNFMLDDKGKMFLIDFGLAKRDSLISTTMIVGTWYRLC